MLEPRRSVPGSAQERRAAGRDARATLRRRDHGALPDLAARRDPVAVIEASNAGRLAPLVPVRHHRMAASAFAFYRGGAAIMAADLALTPSTPLRVQLCGDCHLANFGLYATPERNLIFDLNDFDETARGPFEWDVKRLAASAVMASRANGHSAAEAREAARSAVHGYREATVQLAGDGPLHTWYRRVSAEDLVTQSARMGTEAQEGVERMVSRARRRTNATAASRLTQVVDGDVRLVQPAQVRTVLDDARPFVRACLASYRRSLAPPIRALYDRYDVLDVALRVVGVGSVGLGAWIVLLESDEEQLILQLKQARASVLEEHGATAPERNAGQRVVYGQRTMQAASDLLLGWLRTPTGDDYYVRQLRDMKGSAPLEELPASVMATYAWLCGAVLARAHACSGDATAIAGYIGTGAPFADAIAAYAIGYADLAERDYEAFMAAIESGRLAASPEPLVA